MSRHEVIGSGTSWSVTLEGEVVAGPYSTFHAADIAAGARDRKAKTTTRACITCGEDFRSEGVHHRMCKRCRTNSHFTHDGRV